MKMTVMLGEPIRGFPRPELRTFLAIAAVLRGLVVSASCRAAPSRIPNAGLEDGTDSPAHWSIGDRDGGTSRWSWDVESVHEGRRAFRIRKDNREGHSELLSDFLTVEPGKQYEVSAWVRLNRRTDADVHLMVSQYRSDSDDLQLPNSFGEKPNYTLRLATGHQIHYREWVGKWRRLQLAFTVREPNARARIHAIVSGESCDVSWDSFAISPTTKQQDYPLFEPVVNEVLTAPGPNTVFAVGCAGCIATM